MSPRTRNALRARLIAQLGGKCARCPATEYLQFDCIKPMGPAHHRMFSDNRLKFYQFQLEHENLQLLCPKCHTFKTKDEWRRKHHVRVALAPTPPQVKLPPYA